MDKKLQGFAVTGSEDAAEKGAKGGAIGGKSNNPKKGMGSKTPEERSRLGKIGYQTRMRKQREAEQKAAESN